MVKKKATASPAAEQINSPQPSKSSKLLTARQLAESFGLHVITIYKWAARGRIPSIKLSNGSLRFHPDHIQTFLTERTVGGA
jgi:excisionase family DNA binding protein